MKPLMPRPVSRSQWGAILHADITMTMSFVPLHLSTSSNSPDIIIHNPNAAAVIFSFFKQVSVLFSLPSRWMVGSLLLWRMIKKENWVPFYLTGGTKEESKASGRFGGKAAAQNLSCLTRWFRSSQSNADLVSSLWAVTSDGQHMQERNKLKQMHLLAASRNVLI